MIPDQISVAAIERGTYGAFCDVLDSAGYFPITREDILKAIAAGVRQAISEHLDRNGLTKEDI
jgi:hypothetical protein